MRHLPVHLLRTWCAAHVLRLTKPIQGAIKDTLQNQIQTARVAEIAQSSPLLLSPSRVLSGHPSNGYEQSLELGFRLLAEPAGTAYFDESATQLKVFNGFNL